MTDQNKKAKNWSLIIGLAIPVVMVLFIALSVYLPRIFDNTPAPTVNFLYTSGNSYTHRLEVKDHQLKWVENNNSNREKDDEMPTIYLHDVKTNTSSEISYADSQKLTLESRQESPDGYKIEQSRRQGFFLFDYRGSREHYLVNGHAAHELKLEYKNNYYYGFNFLGWVIK